jgi:hypothetical protein
MDTDILPTRISSVFTREEQLSTLSKMLDEPLPMTEEDIAKNKISYYWETVARELGESESYIFKVKRMASNTTKSPTREILNGNMHKSNSYNLLLSGIMKSGHMKAAMYAESVRKGQNSPKPSVVKTHDNSSQRYTPYQSKAPKTNENDSGEVIDASMIYVDMREDWVVVLEELSHRKPGGVYETAVRMGFSTKITSDIKSSSEPFRALLHHIISSGDDTQKSLRYVALNLEFSELHDASRYLYSIASSVSIMQKTLEKNLQMHI